MSQMITSNNWKPKVLVIGALVGAAVGVGTAYLMARTAEENRGGPPEITTADLLKAGLAIFGTMRGIAALGDR
jgi:hypothetical protein